MYYVYMLYVLHVGAWKSSLLAKGFPTLNKIPNSQFPKRTQAHTHTTLTARDKLEKLYRTNAMKKMA